MKSHLLKSFDEVLGPVDLTRVQKLPFVFSFCQSVLGPVDLTRVQKSARYGFAFTPVLGPVDLTRVQKTHKLFNFGVAFWDQSI